MTAGVPADHAPTLAEFVLARVAEDEEAARAAIDPERPGIHWQWVTVETDTPVPPSDIGEALGEQNLSLRSVEEFETPYVGPLPAFVVHGVEEGHAGGLAHIARHDPARVLAECEAKRAIVGMLSDQERRLEQNAQEHAVESSRDPHDWDHIAQLRTFGWELQGRVTALRETVKVLARIDASHPDFRAEWAP